MEIARILDPLQRIKSAILKPIEGKGAKTAVSYESRQSDKLGNSGDNPQASVQ